MTAPYEPTGRSPDTLFAAAARRRMDAEPLLRLRGIGKHFGAVQALDHVDLDLPERTGDRTMR